MSAPQTPTGATPTPGKWRSQRRPLVYPATLNVVCEVGYEHHVVSDAIERGHAQANAALIASAPDLLAERDALLDQVAALKAALSGLVSGTDKLLASELPPVVKAVAANYLRAVDDARAALAEVAS